MAVLLKLYHAMEYQAVEVKMTSQDLVARLRAIAVMSAHSLHRVAYEGSGQAGSVHGCRV